VIQAIIFDLDGLLVNSEPLWRRAEAVVFRGLGIDLTDTELAATTGIRLDEVVRIRHRAHPWNTPSLPEVEQAILDELEILIRSDAGPTPGAVSTVRFFEERGLPLAVASSSPLRVIEAQLRKLALLDAFAVLRSAEFEKLGKPYPGVYLSTAAALNVEPRLCLAFEDSMPGLIAAKAANMRTVAVPDPEFARHPGFGVADLVLPSLEHWNNAHWQRFRSGEGALRPSRP